MEHECNDGVYHREFPPTIPSIVTYLDVSNENSLTEALPEIPGLFDNIIRFNEVVTTTGFEVYQPRSDFVVPGPSPLSYVPQNFGNHDLIDQMRLNFRHLNNDDFEPRYDMDKIQDFIFKMPRDTVKQFLRSEIKELDTRMVNYNPKALRSKLFKYNRIPETVVEKSQKDRKYWLRSLNMFIFGVHCLNNGKYHMNFLRKFLATNFDVQNFNEAERRSLFTSYCYIFNSGKHPNVNYYKLMKLLIDRLEKNL